MLNSFCTTLTTVLSLRDWKLRSTLITELRHDHAMGIEVGILCISLTNNAANTRITIYSITRVELWLSCGHLVVASGIITIVLANRGV